MPLEQKRIRLIDIAPSGGYKLDLRLLVARKEHGLDSLLKAPRTTICAWQKMIYSLPSVHDACACSNGIPFLKLP